jgi:uncharacterized protein
VKVDIRRLPQEGSIKLEEVCSASILELDNEGVKLISPLHIQAEVSKDLGTINVNANIKTRISLTCSRCLDNFEKDINKELRFRYPINSTDSIVDLTDQIRQEIILSNIPIKPICSDSCKGLCPNCGKNLNSEECKCSKAK